MLNTQIKLLSSFPEGFHPNNAQQEIIRQLAKALDAKKKFIIINAPTATGKSFIAKTISNYSSAPSKKFIKAAESNKDIDIEYRPFGAAILTVTKNLQEQYIQMFPEGSVLKGKSNYPCAINEELNCEHGHCLFAKTQKKKCLKQNICPYINAYKSTITNKCSFYNYSMFCKLKPKWKHKEFIICDEASELEQEIVGQHLVTYIMLEMKHISKNIPPTPNVGSKSEVYYKWLEEISRLTTSEYQSLCTKLSKKKKPAFADIKRLNLLLQYKEDTQLLLDTWNQTQYLVKHLSNALIFQPYNVDKLSYNIFDYGKTIILMSATIVDHKSFANTLGIKDYSYIEVKTTLDPKLAPIKVLEQFFLNYRNRQELLPEMCKVVDVICAHHKGQKGIIHTHSMEILKYIQDYCEDTGRFLFRKDGLTNEQLLDMHKATDKDTILVSPSMAHGVDLKGDLGEFQIIMKTPYLPLNDDRVAMKFKNDQVWYVNAMLSTLIQMCGRCNRISKDYSITYILDANVLSAIAMNKDKLPQYFLERFA